MFGIENYLGFVVAGIVLNLTPGADTMYILTRSVAEGRRAGYYSVGGIITGTAIHTLFASLGLSIILAKSALAFSIVKYFGCAYLIYLGIKMLTDKANIFENDTHAMKKFDLGKIYKQGVLTNVLNPKVALFYLAFLPQFINPEYTEGTFPFLLLGATFMTTLTIWSLFLVYTSSFLTMALRNNDKISRAMQKISGAIFIGLGIRLLTIKK